jgi:hypothetical protein
VRCNGEKKEAEEEEEEEEEGKEEKQSVRSAVAIKTREKRRKLFLLNDITLPLPPPPPPMAFFLHIFCWKPNTHTQQINRSKPNRSKPAVWNQSKLYTLRNLWQKFLQGGHGQ